MEDDETRLSALQRVCSAGLGGVFVTAAMALTAPSAIADPQDPAPPPPPAPALDTTPLADEADAPPPAEIPHLASPDNLPPGTSNTPVGPPQGRTMGYLRELWHAIQTQDVSMADALLLLTQRPLDPNATPPPGVPTGPQPPLPPPEPAPAPAPEPPPPPAPTP